MNELFILGNLVADPQTRSTPNGKSLCQFRVAVNEGDKATFFDVTAWERLGETCATYLKKGSKVLASGRASCKPYIGKDGTAHGNVMLTATHVEFLSPKGDTQRAAEQAMANDIAGIDLDDIGF